MATTVAIGFNEHRPDEGTETVGQRRELRCLVVGFNEHRPDEGTETGAFLAMFGGTRSFNEHRPDEGTETSEYFSILRIEGQASMNIDPMRVLKLRFRLNLLQDAAASMNIDPMRVLKR